MNVFFTMQGKGGIGKSFVSYLLAQYLSDTKEKPLCIDTDQVNRTFNTYKALDVKVVDLIENNRINPRNFDKVIDLILSSETDCIIDAGSSNFTEITAYLIENEIFNFLQENGFRCFLNLSLVGGKETDDNIKVLSYMFKHYSNAVKSILWINPHFGYIDLGGKTVEELGVYKNNIQAIEGVVYLPENSNTFKEDIAEMTTKNLTINEYLENDKFFTMNKQRLSIFKKKTWQAISVALQGI